MSKNSSGIVHIFLILVVIAVAGGVLVFGKDKLSSIINIGNPEGKPIDDGGLTAPMGDWKTYTNSKYKYQLNFPSDWTVSEESGANPTTNENYEYVWFKSLDGNFSFTFGLRHKSETNLSLSTRTGTPAGDFMAGETIYVGGFDLYTKKIVYEGKTNTVLFSTDEKDEKYEVYGDFSYIGTDREFMTTTDLISIGEYQRVKSILASLKFQ